MNSQECIQLSLSGSIATLIVNNPPMNPLSQSVLDGLRAALSRLEQERDLRAVILTGAGEKAFVAGADIKEFTSWTPESAVDLTARGQRLFNDIENFPVPFIAAVNGYALGGGLELALACDIRIASRNAKLGLPEASLGIIPGYGGTQRLSRTISVGQAKKMVYTAEMIDAQKALELGLVQDVVDQSELVPFANALAEKIAANGPVAVRQAKKAINAERAQSLPYGTAIELRAAGTVFASLDRLEGVQAFIEKRKPVFKNM